MRRAASAPEHHRAKRDRVSHGYKPVGNQHLKPKDVRRNGRREHDSVGRTVDGGVGHHWWFGREDTGLYPCRLDPGGEVLGSPGILRTSILPVRGGEVLAETQVVGRSEVGDGGVRAFGSVGREALNIGNWEAGRARALIVRLSLRSRRIGSQYAERRDPCVPRPQSRLRVFPAVA